MNIKFKTIKMNRNQSGSPDGISIQLYKSGETYKVPEDLAKSFVENLKCASYTNPVSNIVAGIKEDKEIKKAKEDANFNPVADIKEETKVDIKKKKESK